MAQDGTYRWPGFIVTGFSRAHAWPLCSACLRLNAPQSSDCLRVQLRFPWQEQKSLATSLSFFSLVFRFLSRKTSQLPRIFYTCRTHKIPGKDRENTKITKEIPRFKFTKEIKKKPRKRRIGFLLAESPEKNKTGENLSGSCARGREEKRRKAKKNEKNGKIPPTSSTPTPLRTSQTFRFQHCEIPCKPVPPKSRGWRFTSEI